MTETLADIEALALSCRSEQSKAYISEALNCYRAGAYRAAIVTAWIAVVFDLIDKIRELSLAGEKAAESLEKQFQTYIDQIEGGNSQGIRNAIEFERNIIETCRNELEFFDPQQTIDLERLREDRHRCAHPSFHRIGVPYQPSAEQARLHIRNAIAHVLSQPPIQGKAALDELKSMVSSAYFPTETKKAFEQLKSSSLATATDALVRGFVDQLTLGFLTKGDDLFYKDQVIAALNAAFEMYPEVVESRIRKQLNKAVRDVPDKQFTGAARLAASLTQAWNTLESASRDKIRSFVWNGPPREVIGELNALSKIEELIVDIKTRIEGLDFEDLVLVVESQELREFAKERALSILSEAGSWDRANSVFTKAVLPVFSYLNRIDVERIIRMPNEHGSDLLGAHGYRLFIDAVRESSLMTGEELDKLLSENGAEYLVEQEE